MAASEAQLWSALGGSVTIIIALVGYISNRISKDIEGQQKQLESGAKAFKKIEIRLAEMDLELESMEALQAEVGAVHDTLIKITRDHKRFTGEEIEIKKG